MSWQLRRITLHNPQLYAAVNDRGCAPLFNSKDLWSSDTGTSVVLVNALTEKRFDFTLDIEGTVPDESVLDAWRNFTKLTDRPTLEQISRRELPGFIAKFSTETGKNGLWEDLAETAEVEATFDTRKRPTLKANFRNVDLKYNVSRRRYDEPWACVTRFKFEITITATPNMQEKMQVTWLVEPQPKVELYAICPALPKFLRYEGVPISLLRFALGPRYGYDPMNHTYVLEITRRVFHSGFKYERDSGSYSFTGGAGYPTQLTKFLRIWTILNKSAPEDILRKYGPQYEKNPPTVNCMDQTGILGICMSFACVDEDDRKSLLAYFVKPFGFLHDTPLVGFSHDHNNQPVNCNNPLRRTFVDVPELYIKPTARNRSYFGSHVFLEFRDRIFDACAGPYLGGTDQSPGDLKAYLTEAVDRTPGTFPPTFRDSATKQAVTPADISRYCVNPDAPQDIRPAPIYDEHGGILGEAHNLMLDEQSWKVLPEELNRELDDKNFALDIPSLGATLIKETQNSSDCIVEAVETPLTDINAIAVKSGVADYGEVEWPLIVNSERVTLFLRIFPSFELAAAARANSHDNGNSSSGPSKEDLAKNQVISSHRNHVLHVTSIAGRFLIECQSADLDEPVLKSLVMKVREMGLREGDAMWVGNESSLALPHPYHRTVNKGSHCLFHMRQGAVVVYVVAVSVPRGISISAITYIGAGRALS